MVLTSSKKINLLALSGSLRKTSSNRNILLAAEKLPPGSLKNALDWLVSSGELNDKPVAAISASPLPTGGDKALTSLLLTLKALALSINNHAQAAS
jgi:NAD(P)H-dependent FMN reductase